MTTKNHRDEVVTDPNRPVASERRPYLEPSRSPPHEPRLAAWETPVRLPAAEGVWALQDLNLRPKDYESSALTN